MVREKRDLYDKNGKLTNLTYFKGDKIPTGYYPMVVMVCIQNSNGEFLMQKRSPKKGGDWGITGGHPKSGETPEQGLITEIYEELGIFVDPTKNKFELFSEGCDGVDCYKMYYLKLDINLDSLSIQQEELSEVKWFSIETLKDMVNKKILNQNQIASFEKCIKYLNNKTN